VSNALVELKEEATNNLLAKLVPTDTLAKQQYIEGLPDTSDMRNSNEE